MCLLLLLLLCSVYLTSAAPRDLGSHCEPPGDEQLDPQDLNPFSFREFLRSKNQDQDPEQDLSQVVQLQSAAEEEDEDEGQDMSLTFDPEVRSCFFLRPSLALQVELLHSSTCPTWSQ